ncbi:MAG: hypothetical protein ABH986_02720, partial [archaeon]
MNKKSALMFLIVFLALLIDNVGAVGGEPGLCSPPGATQACTTLEGCPGTRVCDEFGAWGECIDTPSDGCPGATPTVTLTWRYPDVTPWRIPWDTWGSVTILCNNSPCNTMSATLQWCKGIDCTNFQSITTTGDITLFTGYSTTYYTASIATGAEWKPLWRLVTTATAPYDGETYRLRIKVIGGNTVPTINYIIWDKLLVNFAPTAVLTAPAEGTATKTGNVLAINWTTSDVDYDTVKSYLYYAPKTNCTASAGTNFYTTTMLPVGAQAYNWTVPSIAAGEYCVFVRPQDSYEYGNISNDRNITVNLSKAEVNNIAGDTTAPYIDLLNDKKTDLVLNITTNDGIECKWAATSFDPVTQGTNCTMNSASSSTCGLGSLVNGNYSRYYACKNNFTWSPIKSVDFTVDLTSLLSAAIVFPKDGNAFLIGETINFDSNIYSNFFNYTVQWDSNTDTDWKPSQEDFSYSGLSIADHLIGLKAVFDIGGGNFLEKTGSVKVRVYPVPQDILRIVEFELVYIKLISGHPAMTFKLTTNNDYIQVKTKIQNVGPVD